MTPEIESVIKVFSRFLDSKFIEDKKVKKIDNILKFPIFSFNFLDKEQAQVLEEELRISSIDDASKLNKDAPFESLNLAIKDTISKDDNIQEVIDNKIKDLKEKYPNIEKKLKKTIFISSLIKKIKKQAEELDPSISKVVCVGLENAGKTAILTRLGGRLGINDLVSLKPTKGIERKRLKMNNLDLIVWDFGGQVEYRKKYMKDPETYFLQIDLLIYVIDVQDPDKFEESFKYFSKILDIIKTLEESPHILIFGHKFDHDIKNDPNILLNVELFKDNLQTIQDEYDLNFEIYLTSIFSLFTREPKFSKTIKELMNTDQFLSDPSLKKVEALEKILEKTMNVVIRLSESLSSQLSDIDCRLRAIESGAFKIAQSGVPIEIQTPNQAAYIKEMDEERSRAQVLSELKDIFARRRKLEL